MQTDNKQTLASERSLQQGHEEGVDKEKNQGMKSTDKCEYVEEIQTRYCNAHTHTHTLRLHRA